MQSEAPLAKSRPRAVLVRPVLDAYATKTELWVVPVDGGPRRKLDIDIARIATFANGRISVHPDGRQLAYLSGDARRYEVMVIENLPPVASGSRLP